MVAVGSEGRPDADLLTRLLTCAQNQMAKSPESRGLLLDMGIVDESIWERYGVGACGMQIFEQLSDSDRGTLIELGYMRRHGTNALTMPGIILPTFDPQNPGKPVALVKIAPAQNRHGWVGKPGGLGMPVDVFGPDRIVICDSPMLCLRLAQMGTPCALLAESIEVFADLVDWLKEKELIIASCSKASLANYAKALEDLGLQVQAVRVNTEVRRMTSDVAKRLGLSGKPPVRTVQRPELKSDLVAELHAYAQRRIQSGHGLELLRSYDADMGELVQALQIGHVPDDYRDTLEKDDYLALSDRWIASTLVLPATDERGVAVDLYAVKKPEERSVRPTLFENPKGLLCARVYRAYEEVIAVEHFRTLSKLWREGIENVVILRGKEDAEANLERLKGYGLKKVTFGYWRPAQEIVEVFEEAGIETVCLRMPKAIEDLNKVWLHRVGLIDHRESDFPEPELIEHDTRTERATFRSRDLTYRIQTTPHAESLLEVEVERDGRKHRDRFDLAIEAQRERYAESASLTSEAPKICIARHLVSMLEAVRELQRSTLLPDAPAIEVVAIGEEDRKEAEEYLRSTDLLDLLAKDLESLGAMADPEELKTLVLVAVSRKLERPLSAILSGPVGPQTLDLVRSVLPPEAMVSADQLDRGNIDLANKTVLIGDLGALRRRTASRLRLLQTRGALSSEHADLDAHDRRVTRFSEARGPVGIIACDAKGGTQDLLRCINLGGHLSEEHRKQVLEKQCGLFSGNAGRVGELKKTLNRLQSIQRLLNPHPVVIPFARSINFPAMGPGTVAEQEKFLILIQASALLNQRQRLKANGNLIATEADFKIAKELFELRLSITEEGLSGNARTLLANLAGSGLNTFTLADVTQRGVGWSRSTTLRAINELLKLQYLVSPAGKRGRQRSYELTDGAVTKERTVAISLQGGVVQLSKVVQTDLDRFIPDVATG